MDKQKNWKKQIILFLISQNLSIFGSSVVGFSIIWYITLETSSGTWITISTIAVLIPQVVISLWAGVIADRYNRKLIVMISDSFTALATLIAFIVFQSGKESLEILIIISFLRSIGGGFQAPAVSALYPQIVPEDKLVRINGISQTLNNILLLISPAVGGFVLGTMGIKWTFLIDVSTALIAVIIVSLMKIENKACNREEKSTVIFELKEGIKYMLARPILKTIAICYAVTFVLITPAAFLSPLMVSRNFGNEVWRLTANEMFWSLGSIIGGLFIAWKGNFKNKTTAISIALIGFGSTFALMGLTNIFWIYLFLDCICGIFLPVLVTAETVMIQTNTENDYMGRVFSLLQFISQGVMPIAILGLGPLGDKIEIQYIIVTCGILLSLWAIWFKKEAGKAINEKL